jgi:zinc/manganese transport system substrate-binding protein/manganese/iron transport system substrate-binding protein
MTPMPFRLPRRAAALLLALLLLPLAAACGSAPAGQSGGPTAGATPASSPAAGSAVTARAGKVRVITTMSVLADMVRQVGGERVEAENIIPIGAGPEDYQPTPSDAQKIAQADVLFFNGFGLESWLDDLFKSAAKPGMPMVAVARGLTPVDVGGKDFKEGNPHFWLSAVNGIQYVQAIRDALIQVDPQGQDTYVRNAERYTQELSALHAELHRMAETLPPERRKLVTNHDAFPYFAQAYGFTVVGNVLSNPESEPSAGDIAALVQSIKRENVKAIFTEAQFSPRLTDTIAQEAGVKVVANVYTDTLGDSSSGVTSYADMLRYDMKVIVDSLK